MKRHFICNFAAAAVLLIAASLGAQPNYADSGVPETDGAISAIHQVGNTVYVGGRFTTIGGESRNALAAFDAITGVVDPAWDPNLQSSGAGFVACNDIAEVNGLIHVIGSFDTVNGGTPRSGAAAFEPANGVNAGVADAQWDPSLGGAYPVGGGILVSSEIVYMVGQFSTVNGSVTRNGAAAVAAADGVATGEAVAWDPNLGGSLPWGYPIATDGNFIYIGGPFTGVNGSFTRNRLAAFDPVTGAADPIWDPDVTGGSFPQVVSLAVEGSHLYVGGEYLTVNGSTPRSRLAAFELAGGVNAGTADPAWDPDMNDTPSTLVASLLPHSGVLYVGGSFVSVNGGATTRHGACAFNFADGSSAATPTAWNPDFTGGSTTTAGLSLVMEIAPSSTGLFVGGDFTEVNGQPVDYLAGFGSTVPAELSVFQAD